MTPHEVSRRRSLGTSRGRRVAVIVAWVSLGLFLSSCWLYCSGRPVGLQSDADSSGAMPRRRVNDGWACPRASLVNMPIRRQGGRLGMAPGESNEAQTRHLSNGPVRLCQALGPAAPYAICGVDCFGQGGCGCRCGQNNCGQGNCGPVANWGSGNGGPGWESARLIEWQHYAQGEYCGPARTAHVHEYRLRVDDMLDLNYRLTREEQPNPYQLNVGDEVRVESAADPDLDRDVIIQPDGTITLRLLGQVRATGSTVPQLRERIEELYRKYYKLPAITVSPLRVNSKLDDLRNSVDSRFGQVGQNLSVRVTPEGTISLPAIGVIQAQGLTLQELRVELREAYLKEVEGIEVIPVLVQRAPRYVYVLGEVALPGRYEMSGPTTLMQALAMAGGWNVGAHLRQVVVFRRGEDWRLMATMLNIHPALYGKQPCPPAEIWLSDSDVIVVPKHPIKVADEFIELVFTRGIYGVFPMNAALNFSKLSSI